MDIDFSNNTSAGDAEIKYADLSGNGNDLNIPSNITRRPIRISGGSSEGFMHFDGIDDLMYALNSSSLDRVKTIELWASVESTNSSMGILSKYAMNPERGYIIAFPFIDGKYYFKFIADGNELLAEPIDQYLGKWAHYVLTIDQAGCKLYINGLLVRNGQGCSSTKNNTEYLCVCADGNWYRDRFKGFLGAIRLYSRPISADEVRSHFMCGKRRFNTSIAWEDWISEPGNHALEYPNAGGFAAATKNKVWLRFNTSGCRVVSRNMKGIDLKGDFAIVASVRPESVAGRRTIVKIGRSSSQNDKDAEYIIGIDQGALFTVTGNGVTSNYTAYDLRVPADTWSIIACGVDASRSWCSVNGSIKAGNERAGYASLENTTIIGSNINGTSRSGNFLGDIDYVYIFNRTLTKDQLTAIINNDRVTGSASISSPDKFYSGNWFQKEGSILSVSGNGLYKSIDDGKTYSLIYTFQNVSKNALNTLITQDSKNNTFITFANDGGRVWVSSANLDGSPGCTNFRVGLVMRASNGTGAGLDSFQELSNGDILLGEYGNDPIDGTNARIYRTSDNGRTWSISFNDSQYSAGLNYTSPGKHMHFVKQDPYTGYIYASIGDSSKNRKLIFSADNGRTWDILKHGISDDYDWQPTTVAFTEDYRIYGEDWSSTGLNSRIFRTKDDVNYETVCNGDSKYLGAWYWSVKDNNGRIYFGLAEVPLDANLTVVASDDNGTSWYVVYKANGGGYFTDLPSNVGSKNQFYINLQNYEERIEKTIRMRSIEKPAPVAEWRFNEDMGSDAHDAAFGNNAKVINAIWQDDGAYSTLAQDVDYELSTNGTFSMKNSCLDWAMVHARYYI